MSTPILNFGLISGDFHAEGDLCFALAEASGTTIQEKDELLIEKRLPLSQDSFSGVQCLFDHEIVLERSDQG
jgi:hypothetical protein